MFLLLAMILEFIVYILTFHNEIEPKDAERALGVAAVSGILVLAWMALNKG